MKAITNRVFLYVMPGLFLLILFFLPVFYFGHLLKKEKCCIELIAMNKNIKGADAVIKEKCSCFNLDELYSTSKQSSEKLQ
ncbi:MAG: hypothetical protein ACK5NK_01990 [Niabella sp.]